MTDSDTSQTQLHSNICTIDELLDYMKELVLHIENYRNFMTQNNNQEESQ